ncbi:hypothetical protein ACODT5_09710 [Streptomyces sp. 5.8]
MNANGTTGEAARAGNAMPRSPDENDLYEQMARPHGARPLWEETA